jgi:hypothetical protein
MTEYSSVTTSTPPTQAKNSGQPRSGGQFVEEVFSVTLVSNQFVVWRFAITGGIIQAMIAATSTLNKNRIPS